jgi:NAD(P)-dependent dehydrogenase (short-subunit alcohol dehydrogenase family)
MVAISYVVTGGGRGVGRAIVERLLAERETVAVIELDESALAWVDGHPAAARIHPVIGWRRVGDRLLMPLPTNEAQEPIARRLAHHRNVAMQGPPGTGNTHTIRNLMANGKRVLVAAPKEERLPGAVRRAAGGRPVAVPGRARPDHRPARPAATRRP